MEKQEYVAGAGLYSTHALQREGQDVVDQYAEEWMRNALPGNLEQKVIADAGVGTGPWIPLFRERSGM